MKLVIWTDKTHLVTEHSWEYENDPDWFMTVDLDTLSVSDNRSEVIDE